MAEDNLEYRISADADDAIRDTERVSQEQQNLARETGEAGQAADQAAQQQGRLGQAVGRLGRSVRGMVTSWLGFTAIAGTIIGLIRSIRRESDEALDSITDLGDRVRDLSVNLGENADRITDHASAISRTEDQREQLIDFATELTDRRPGLAARPEEVERRLDQAAPVALATGERGDQIARTMLALEDVGFDRPADAAAMFMTGALGAQDIERLAQRGGREGLELTEAMIRTGTVDPRRARRQLPRIFGELTETDEMGRPDEELRELGITADMDLVERLRLTIDAVRGEDPERRGIARGIIGADRVREMAPALEAALAEGGALEGVREDVRDTRARDVAERALESDLFRRSIERQGLELRETLRQESEERSDRAMREERQLDRLEQEMQERGFTPIERSVGRATFRVLQGVGLVGVGAPDEGEEPNAFQRIMRESGDALGGRIEERNRLLRGAEPADEARGQTINHITNIGEQYNNGTDPETEGSEMVPRPE